jgi:hypothetical protein
MATNSKIPSMNLSAALALLQGPQPGRHSNTEPQRVAFVKHFKSISTANRNTLCDEAAKSIKNRFEAGQTPDDIVLLLTTAIASERDSETTSTLLESLLTHVSNSDALKDVVLSLLEIADNELSEERNKIPLGQTALVLVTEMGLMIANKAGKSALDFNGMARVVEYITSSLLARSNINETAMRLSLVHYLARCPLNSQATSQLNRVMTRFGQSLLDELLSAYFTDKKRANAAFHFLVQYLNVFFVASPGLSQMAHDVLKHYMLKHADSFAAFMKGYCTHIPKEEIRLAATARHIAILLNAAVEVSKRPLAEDLSLLLIQTLERFRDISPDALFSQTSLVKQIVNLSLQKDTSISFVAEEFLNSADALVADARNVPFGKVLAFATPGKPRKGEKRGHTKPSKSIQDVNFGTEPTPLETVLTLAS